MATNSSPHGKTVIKRRVRQRSANKKTVPQVIKQKKAYLALAGIGATGFTDISVKHDTYLHEKP